MRMEEIRLARKEKIDGLEFVESISVHGREIDEKDNKELYTFVLELLSRTNYCDYVLDKILKTYEKSYVIVIENEREKNKTYLTFAELIEAMRG
jgi:hypothetical protein